MYLSILFEKVIKDNAGKKKKNVRKILEMFQELQQLPCTVSES